MHLYLTKTIFLEALRESKRCKKQDLLLMKKKVLSLSQKKKFIKWEVPHLMQALKEEHQIITRYLSFSSKNEVSFIFKGKTFFPLSVGESFLGFLVCVHKLSTLKAQRTESFIHSYLKKAFAMSFPNSLLKKSLSEENAPKKQFKHLEECIEETKELGFLDFAFPEEDFKFPFEETKNFCHKSALKEVEGFPFNKQECFSKDLSRVKKHSKMFFPILVKTNQKEEFLKTAYSLYLKSSCFAFLNAEDLEWKEKIFQELNGVFVCIPSFHNLSVFQKEVFLQDLLQKKLSCSIVLGLEKKEGFMECQNLFDIGS